MNGVRATMNALSESIHTHAHLQSCFQSAMKGKREMLLTAMPWSLIHVTRNVSQAKTVESYARVAFYVMRSRTTSPCPMESLNLTHIQAKYCLSKEYLICVLVFSHTLEDMFGSTNGSLLRSLAIHSIIWQVCGWSHTAIRLLYTAAV